MAVIKYRFYQHLVFERLTWIASRLLECLNINFLHICENYGSGFAPQGKNIKLLLYEQMNLLAHASSL